MPMPALDGVPTSGRTLGASTAAGSCSRCVDGWTACGDDASAADLARRPLADHRRPTVDSAARLKADGLRAWLQQPRQRKEPCKSAGGARGSKRRFRRYWNGRESPTCAAARSDVARRVRITIIIITVLSQHQTPRTCSAARHTRLLGTQQRCSRRIATCAAGGRLRVSTRRRTKARALRRQTRALQCFACAVDNPWTFASW